MSSLGSSTALGLALRGQPILYKLWVGSREAVPPGIREEVRLSDREMDKRHAERAVAAGDRRAAMDGRVRPDRVDTGQAVYQRAERVRVVSIRSLLALQGYRLNDVHFFVRNSGAAVIVMGLYATEREQIRLEKQTLDALRALARENVWKVDVWDNGNSRPSTINLTSRQQCRPWAELAIREGYLRLIDVDEVADASQREAEEDAQIAGELLQNLEAFRTGDLDLLD